LPLKGRPRAASIQSWKPQANGRWIVRNEASNPCPCRALRLVSRRRCQIRCRSAFAGPQSAHRLAQAGAAPPLPDRNPMRPGKPVEAKPVLPGEQPRVPWTEAEIDAAKAKCKELLAGDPLDYEILPPIKDWHLWDACAGPVARGRHQPE